MDLTALMSTLLSEESINGVGQKAGASNEQVRGVLGSALPLLLSGANAQATNVNTASSFAGALQQHAQNDTSNVGSFLGNVDMLDGAKIVAHLLGVNTASQTQTFAQQNNVSTATTGNILATAAPLLMSLIGQQAQPQNTNSANVGGLMGSLLGSGDMTSLLGGLLGGGAAAQQPLQQVQQPFVQPQQPVVQPVQQQKTGLLAKLLSLLK